MIVLGQTRNRIRIADGLLFVIKADWGQLVVRAVTRGEGADEPHGLKMENIAVEEKLSKADNKIADEAREDDSYDT